MRRIFVLLLFVSILTNLAFGQLYVNNSGNVGFKVEEGPINSAVSIYDQGYSVCCANIKADSSIYDTGLRISNYGTPNTSNDYVVGIRSYARPDVSSSKKAYGIIAHAYKTSGIESNYGRSYGIYALGGNGSPGYNYGVFGTLYGNNNGAGVFGSSESWDGGVDTGDRYAGYFHGKVKVTNTVEATAFNLSSDYRLKENIKPLESDIIDNIMKLNVVKYNLRQRIVDVGDTAKATVYYYTEDSNLLERTHYGLIAQELQQIYPDLVYEGKDGYLSVNYMEIIPILIKKIQELELKIEKLDNVQSKAAMRNAGTTNVSDIESLPFLYQNNPNPFTENTTIKCLIPNSVRSALLYIYDMNGRQIDSMPISDRDNVTITIEGSRLDAGMYMYSLVTDGNLIDTKRMILTK